MKQIIQNLPIILIVTILLAGCSKYYNPIVFPTVNPSANQNGFSGVLITPLPDFKPMEENPKIFEKAKNRHLQFIPVKITNLTMDTVVIDLNNLEIFADFEPQNSIPLGQATKKLDKDIVFPSVLLGLGVLSGIQYNPSDGLTYKLNPLHFLCLAAPYFLVKNAKYNFNMKNDLDKYDPEGKTLKPGESIDAIIVINYKYGDLLLRYK
ncbi:MAG: hypothetical protein ACOYXB_13055 [Bacteroidota bacterium]